MPVKGVRGVLTFAIGGTILAFLFFLMINSNGFSINSWVHTFSGFYVMLIGFLGFLFVGMGLYGIVAEANATK